MNSDIELFRDLSARLASGVYIWSDSFDGPRRLVWGSSSMSSCEIDLQTIISTVGLYKPLLYPLSSMSLDQRELLACMGYISPVSDLSGLGYIVNYLIDNHFDYSGLIEKGKAIDVTRLNYNPYEDKK